MERLSVCFRPCVFNKFSHFWHKNDVDFKLKTDTAVPLQSVTKSSNLQHLFHLFDSLQQTLLLLLDVDFKLKSATEADFSLNLDGWARDPTRSVLS